MRTRGRVLLSIAGVLAVLGGTWSPAAGQGGGAGGAAPPAGPIPRTPDGKPDLTGNWLGYFTMVDAITFNWTMTIDDPKVFTRPWTMTSLIPMARRPVPVDFDREDTCHEGNVDLVHLKNVYDQARRIASPPR